MPFLPCYPINHQQQITALFLICGFLSEECVSFNISWHGSYQFLLATFANNYPYSFSTKSYRTFLAFCKCTYPSVKSFCYWYRSCIFLKAVLFEVWSKAAGWVAEWMKTVRGYMNLLSTSLNNPLYVFPLLGQIDKVIKRLRPIGWRAGCLLLTQEWTLGSNRSKWTWTVEASDSILQYWCKQPVLSGGPHHLTHLIG